MDARATHQQRLGHWETQQARRAAQDRAIALARVVTFSLAVAVLLGALFVRAYGLVWVLAPFGVFVVLVTIHGRVLDALTTAKDAVAFHAQALLRMDGTWEDNPMDGSRHLHGDHPYAADLDLFGPHSLFALLWSGRTVLGEDTLATWLKAPAPPGTVRQRHDAVRELAVAMDHREALHLASRGNLEPGRLRSWANAPAWNPPVWLRPVLFVLSAVTGVTLVLWWVDVLPLAVGSALCVLEAAVVMSLGARTRGVLDTVARRAEELQALSARLALMERFPARSTLLQKHLEDLKIDGVMPSAVVAALARKLAWADMRHNQVLFPVALALMWSTQWALALESWRRQHGPRLGLWLHVAGSWEALASLAAYHAEHPDDVFPELLDAGPALEATAVGHPLLPARSCVRNDVSLGASTRLLIISGSNMSGKSTYLRAVGCAVVMALAGAPVRARSMRLGPTQLGASMRVVDNLAGGKSRFAAEIARLKLVVDLAGAAMPLLFLLDEILSGTNSHDRQIGAQGVVKGLLDKGAMGMITTHDLALTRMAGELGDRARNVHFQDTMKDGVLVFDFTLRDGVVDHSNALELMRAVGLGV